MNNLSMTSVRSSRGRLGVRDQQEQAETDMRPIREVSLRSAFDAASPSVISGEARVKVDVERVSPWKVLTATLTGVAISAALTFAAMSLF